VWSRAGARRRRREAAAAKQERAGASLSLARLLYFQVITVTVNGQRREVGDDATLRTLIEQFKLTPDKVAIELNKRLVRSDKYDTSLKGGDEVEIVTFVGGG
jgi:thiamine biosynthesis protein ThiS